MAQTRRMPVAPLGPVLDRPLSQTAPAPPAHERVPSGAPKEPQPPAMGWFILAVFAVGIVLLVAFLLLWR